MTFLGVDLGGTKLSIAAFSPVGVLLNKQCIALNKKKGAEVGQYICDQIDTMIAIQQAVEDPVVAIGIAVPGIYWQKTGTVWAPNIDGWDDYPLLAELHQTFHDIPITINSDRACYILGETWMGSAKDCNDAIYLAVGTGIGAGILVDGKILRGSNDIAGATGWMALSKPYKHHYDSCGCFEYHASGEGIAKVAKELLQQGTSLNSLLRYKDIDSITAKDVFAAFEAGDNIAQKVLQQCIEYWGMAVANLISLFNPEKIIMGGGVFGPAVKFIEAIKLEAEKWAQPISMKQVTIEASSLGSDAGLYGAGLLALQSLKSPEPLSYVY